MIITLTSDFGLTDPFVGMMKGVILGIAPNAHVVDLTHEIGSYDVMDAAFIILSAYRYFPQGTIHVVVVDPGVGTSRRPIAAAANEHVFIAPDNGILSFVLAAAERMAPGAPGAPRPAVYHITNTSLFHHPVSRTFHGRDIFAPVAAHLVRGVPLESVGPHIMDPVKRAPPEPRPASDTALIATVLHVDKFGNAVTNIKLDKLRNNFSIRVGDLEIRRLLSGYAQAQPGEFFAIEGSTGYIELSLNQGNAAEKLYIARGSEIEVETGRANQ